MLEYRRYRYHSYDGLVHGTYVVADRDGLGREVFYRVTACNPSGFILTDEKGFRSYDVAKLDIPDEPTPVTCLGCIGAS